MHNNVNGNPICRTVQVKEWTSTKSKALYATKRFIGSCKNLMKTMFSKHLHYAKKISIGVSIEIQKLNGKQRKRC